MLYCAIRNTYCTDPIIGKDQYTLGMIPMVLLGHRAASPALSPHVGAGQDPMVALRHQ